MEKKPHILIVGAGFGGVYTAKYLAHELGDMADVTLVSRDNYFLFTPLLHEVATGNLSHQTVVESVPEIFRGTCVRFLQKKVDRINLEEKVVEAGGDSLTYDYLVIASGAQTNMYGIAGVKENALMLKTLGDAVGIRRQVIDRVKKAAQTADKAEQKRLLSFLVIGGGPTGVELAAELQEFVAQLAESYYSRTVDPTEISITLIAASAELVPQFSKKVRAKSLAVLSKKGVKALLSTAVLNVSADGVNVKDTTEHFIQAGTIIWVAGVEASLPPLQGETHMHKSGRLMVNQFLQVEGHTDVFALGDGAILPMLDGQPPVPQLAQSAVQEAKIAAKNLAAIVRSKKIGSKSAASDLPQLTAFTYHSKGMLISLGFGQAAGDIGGVYFSGPIMWFMWRTIYLFKFNSWRKRFEIVGEWTMNLFSPRDISEI